MLPPPFFPLNKCTLNSLFLFLKLIYLFCCAAAKSLQSCPILCDPIDGNPPGSPIPGILQARTLEWVALSFSNAWKWKVKVKSLSHFWLLETPLTVAHQAPLSMGFSRQEYWSGVPLPSLNLFNWRLIILQYCSGFCHISTWISHGHTGVPYPIPLGHPSAPAPSTLSQSIEPGLVIRFTYDNKHFSMLPSQIIPPFSSPTESKRLFFTPVSLLLSHV